MIKDERNWILYDVGNSAFILLVSTIIPIYYKNIAFQDGISNATSTAYWGYAASISTLIVAIIGPVLGTLGDHKGYRKLLFLSFCLIGIIGCASLAFPLAWVGFLVVFVIAKTGYSGSIIFYDAMLCDVTTEERIDKISLHGFAWGYIGSCIPFVACLGLILTAEKTGFGITNATMMSFIITALWWLLATLPLLKNYKQKCFVKSKISPLKESFIRLGKTLKDIKGNKHIFSFLVAFFLYIDGVYTIIEMATSYGKDVGITDNNLLLALLLTQIIAFPCAIIFGKLTKKMSASKLIKSSIIGYLGISLFALQLNKAWEFWLLAVCVAIFQGGIQALSRSYFAKIVPKDKSNEYFGLYDIFGKGAAFTGTLLMGIMSQITGSSKYGVAAISVLFIIGFFAFGWHQSVLAKSF